MIFLNRLAFHREEDTNPGARPKDKTWRVNTVRFGGDFAAETPEKMGRRIEH